MRLVLIDEDGRDGAGTPTRVELRDEAVVGRDAGCTLRLDDPSVAARHARLWRIGGAWFLSELDGTVVLTRGADTSTGGLARRLAAGDLLTVGTRRLRVAKDDADDHAGGPRAPADANVDEIEGAIARQAADLDPVTVTRLTGLIHRENRRASAALHAQPIRPQQDPIDAAPTAGRVLAEAFARGLGAAVDGPARPLPTPGACVGHGRMLAAVFELVVALDEREAASSSAREGGAGTRAAGVGPDNARVRAARLLAAALDDPQGADRLARHLAAQAEALRDRSAAAQRLLDRLLDSLAPSTAADTARAAGPARAWDAYVERHATLREATSRAVATFNAPR